MQHYAKSGGVAGLSISDPLLCQQKEKYSQTFDEAHVSQVLSLIDGGEKGREKEEGKWIAGILCGLDTWHQPCYL